MENNKTNTCGCDCNGCTWVHDGHNKHWFLKKIFWVFILVVVFCFGTLYGEIKNYSHGRGGYGMMNWEYQDGKAYKMMNWQEQAPAGNDQQAQ